MEMEKANTERVHEIIDVMGKINHIICDTILQCHGTGCDMQCQQAFAILARKYYEARNEN